MIRKDLLRQLALCAPALAKTDFVKIMSHFCFTGSTLYAYNDQIGVVLPCKTEFKGGVAGEVFLGLLNQSKARELELNEIDGNLQIKAGATNKMKLGLESPESFVWACPKSKPDSVIDIGKKVGEFLRCIDSVMHSVSGDTTIPDQLGVTFMAQGDGVAMYATDHHSMSFAHFKLKTKWPARVILPSLFCTHLKTVCAGADNLTIEVHRDHVLATVMDKAIGKITIFSRVIESERPFDFKAEFEDSYPAKAKSQAVPIPSKMKLILERACIISDSKTGRTKTSIRAGEGKLSFISKSDRGEVIDSTQVAEGHPDCKISVEARHLRSVFEAYYSSVEEDNGTVLLTPTCIVLNNGPMVYMLAKSTEATAK